MQITKAGCHRNQLPSCHLPPPPHQKEYWPREGLAWRMIRMIQLFFCAKVLVEPTAWCRRGSARDSVFREQTWTEAPWGGGRASWPLELLLQGSDQNLLTVASRASCQVWPGGRGGWPSCCCPRIVRSVVATVFPESGGAVWVGLPGVSLNELGRRRFESKLSPLLPISVSWKDVKCPPDGPWTPCVTTGTASSEVAPCLLSSVHRSPQPGGEASGNQELHSQTPG